MLPPSIIIPIQIALKYFAHRNRLLPFRYWGVSNRVVCIVLRIAAESANDYCFLRQHVAGRLRESRVSSIGRFEFIEEWLVKMVVVKWPWSNVSVAADWVIMLALASWTRTFHLIGLLRTIHLELIIGDSGLIEGGSVSICWCFRKVNLWIRDQREDQWGNCLFEQSRYGIKTPTLILFEEQYLCQIKQI